MRRTGAGWDLPFFLLRNQRGRAVLDLTLRDWMKRVRRDSSTDGR